MNNLNFKKRIFNKKSFLSSAAVVLVSFCILAGCGGGGGGGSTIQMNGGGSGKGSVSGIVTLGGITTSPGYEFIEKLLEKTERQPEKKETRRSEIKDSLPGLREAVRSAPVAGALVYCEESPELKATSDIRGYFVLREIPPGKIHIIAEAEVEGRLHRMRSGEITVIADTNVETEAIPVIPAVCSLEGRILNKLNNTPLEDVRVTFWGKSTRSDSQGRFEVSGIPSGRWTVVFSKEGFETAVKTFNFDSSRLECEILLEQSGSTTGGNTEDRTETDETLVVERTLIAVSLSKTVDSMEVESACDLSSVKVIASYSDGSTAEVTSLATWSVMSGGGRIENGKYHAGPVPEKARLRATVSMSTGAGQVTVRSAELEINVYRPFVVRGHVSRDCGPEISSEDFVPDGYRPLYNARVTLIGYGMQTNVDSHGLFEFRVPGTVSGKIRLEFRPDGENPIEVEYAATGSYLNNAYIRFYGTPLQVVAINTALDDERLKRNISINSSEYFPPDAGNRYRYCGYFSVEDYELKPVMIEGRTLYRLGNERKYALYDLSNGISLVGTGQGFFSAPLKICTPKPLMGAYLWSSLRYPGDSALYKECVIFEGFENVRTTAGLFENCAKFVKYAWRDEIFYSTTLFYFARGGGFVYSIEEVKDANGNVAGFYVTDLIEGHIASNDYVISKKPWTVAVYMAGDTPASDVTQFLNGDVLELETLKNKLDVMNVLLLYDSLYGENGLYKLGPGGFERIMRSILDPNTGDVNNFKAFLEHAAKMCPADHYLIVIKGHGSGVISAYSPVKRDGRRRVIAYDSYPVNDCLNMAELKEGFEYFTQLTGRKTDIIGFDSCLAGMVEIAYQLRNYGDYMVASELCEPATGWDYATSLSYLDGNIPPLFVAVKIMQDYSARNSTRRHCLAVYNLAAMDALMEALSIFVMEVANVSLFNSYEALALYFSAIATSRLDYYENSFRDYVDLVKMVVEIMSRTSSQTIWNAGSNVLNIFTNYVVPYRCSYPKGEYHFGMGILFPRSSSTWNFMKTQYLTTLWAEDSLWDEFLEYLSVFMN